MSRARGLQDYFGGRLRSKHSALLAKNVEMDRDLEQLEAMRYGVEVRALTVALRLEIARRVSKKDKLYVPDVSPSLPICKS